MPSDPKCPSCRCVPAHVHELPKRAPELLPLERLPIWRALAGKSGLFRCRWCGCQFTEAQGRA